MVNQEERGGAAPSPMILHCLLHGGGAGDTNYFQEAPQDQVTLMMS